MNDFLIHFEFVSSTIFYWPQFFHQRLRDRDRERQIVNVVKLCVRFKRKTGKKHLCDAKQVTQEMIERVKARQQRRVLPKEKEKH